MRSTLIAKVHVCRREDAKARVGTTYACQRVFAVLNSGRRSRRPTFLFAIGLLRTDSRTRGETGLSQTNWPHTANANQNRDFAISRDFFYSPASRQ
jgi:hypothetical protein